MMPPRLFLCSGAKLLPGATTDGRTVKELDTLDPDGNTHLHLDNVTKSFESSLSPRITDLLELATYVFTADCGSKRNGAWIDKSIEQWSRDIKLQVAVRDLHFWARADVNKALKTALDFMTSDTFAFEFCALEKQRPAQSYLGMTQIDETPFHKIDRVTLFSGGLDSLAGTVQAAVAGEPLVLVSHRPVSQIDIRQAALVSKLKSTYNVPIHHIPVWVNKTRFDSEASQRTRVFLFASLAAAVSSVVHAKGIRFFENGVISLNWPLAEEVQLSRASRTTHPETIYLLQSLFRLVLEDPTFVIDNPFIFKTKTEVVETIRDAGGSELIRESCSCIHTMHKAPGHGHCGRCGQCIDRRVAILGAGLEQYDPASDYASDVFTGAREVNPKHPYDHNIAVHYARFARETDRMDDYIIAERYGLEISRAIRRFPVHLKASSRFIEMHKRHSKTVMRVLKQQVERQSELMVNGNLEKSCLLSMLVGDKLELIADQSPEIAMERDCPPAVLVSRPTNIFRQAGEKWAVSYGGCELQYLNNVSGMHYLKHLLLRPHEQVHVLDLYRLLHPEVSHDPVFGLTDIGTLSQNSRAYDPGGSDKSSVEVYKQGIEEILVEEATAMRRGDQVELAEIRARKSELLKVANRNRSSSDPHKKPRQNITRLISSTVDRVRKVMPTLADHLNDSLCYGTNCAYVPKSNIEWSD